MISGSGRLIFSKKVKIVVVSCTICYVTHESGAMSRGGPSSGITVCSIRLRKTPANKHILQYMRNMNAAARICMRILCGAWGGLTLIWIYVSGRITIFHCVGKKILKLRENIRKQFHSLKLNIHAKKICTESVLQTPKFHIFTFRMIVDLCIHNS